MFHFFILGSLKVYGKMQNPGRYSRIDEGRWKDDEKIHVDILGSTKKDGIMKKRYTVLF